MKKIVLIALLIFATLNLFAQTDGINYQAVIIGPDEQELPGVDAQDNILPNAIVAIRFTIIDDNNVAEYQEVQTTNTDQYGRINLMIGAADRDAFTKISWDGTNKELKVEIDFKGGSNYVDMSREQLTFLPYAFHRNINAAGTLKVDNDTFLNGELTVQLPTNLNSTLDVNNNSASNLTGDLTVGGATIIEGITNLNSSLDVNNKSVTNLTGNLNVGDDLNQDPSGEPFDEDATTKLNGTLTVVGKSSFSTQETSGPAKFNLLDAKDLIVKNSSTLNGNNTLIGGINTLTGDNNFGVPNGNDKNRFIGENILIDDNKIGTDNSDKTNITGALSVSTDKQVKITSTLTGKDNNINAYPLLIEGGEQGIAIQVNKTTANSSNDFISFRNGKGASLGRIEGQTSDDLENDYTYQRQKTINESNLASKSLKGLRGFVEWKFSSAEVAAAVSSAAPCVGLGACIAAPVPSLIVMKNAKFILKGAKALKLAADITAATTEMVLFVDSYNDPSHLGVTFLSGNGDYAEYIPKEIVSENFKPGELVGIKNGLVTKDVWGAEKIMIVSTQPIVLGNMPQPNDEINSVKIAFIGQVPVTVIGTVAPGDYILPNLLASGLARAVHPKNMKTRDYKHVAGVVWNVISENSGISIVNVAVGINTNDLTDVVYQQEEEIKITRAKIEQLQIQMEQSNAVRAKLVPGYAEASGIRSTLKANKHNENKVNHEEEENFGNVINGTVYGNEIIYFEIPDELIEKGITLARQVTIEALDDESAMNKLLLQYEADPLQAMNKNSKTSLSEIAKKDFNDDPFWQKMDTNPAFKEEIIRFLKSSLDRAYHTHKKDINKFNEFKIRKD